MSTANTTQSEGSTIGSQVVSKSQLDLILVKLFEFGLKIIYLGVGFVIFLMIFK
jgi:hypothetical protein